MNESLKNQPENFPGEHETSGVDQPSAGPEQTQDPPAETPAQNYSGRKTEDQMRIELLEKDLEKAKDQMLRAMADTENMRKRAAREREDATKFAISGFARDLLSVADNLRRAIEAIAGQGEQEDERLKSLISGIEATEREMLSVFERNGIRKIEPLNQPFDPNMHEVMFEAVMEGQTPGTICQLVQPGYVLHDRLLRPARVGVVKDGGGSGTGGTNGDLPPEPGHNIDTQV
ncbi:MAG: nucleotide exchange factor GrpE [Rhodospirillales bacterium]|nr:nucleotide exchange factor GrpE [Alphaproteobacteria bacterium]MCB1839004.1 nucleotide exchange factor GrpE [Alphaproteobacteria bacterium]MCB9976449.1 nucleotide exchange factor GrpE [Rhodospirillales bacterium]